jgi:hypothetical protein
VFTRKDLEPLRAFLDPPPAHEVLDAAVPVKRADRAQVREQITLPVNVLSREHADGVPLEAILREVQKTTPTATGIVVRGDRVVITYSKPPDPQDKARLDQLLRDASRLRGLEPPAARAAARPPELLAILRDESTPDADWLRAFRRYAVDNLFEER